MNLVVGCPVAHREWILPAWFAHIDRAAETAGLSPTFVFVAHPTDPSIELLHARGATVIDAPFNRGTDVRTWNFERYKQMTDLRNLLLTEVRAQSPDLFWSVDSDILVHPDQLKLLVEDLDRFDAVGGRCYMTVAGSRFPSWANLTRSGLRRVDGDGIWDADVIMALKLMSPAAYNVGYMADLQGEDVGWSNACRAQGLRLGWDGRVIAKHVLAPHLLAQVDPRVGF